MTCFFWRERKNLRTRVKKKNEWTEWGKAIVIAVLIALFLRTFIFSTSIVEGESMAPTLDNGERIIFNKFSYLVGEPNRGDIVIIQRPHKNYVKRVIALPGETIGMINHDLYIKKDKYDQTFITEYAQKQSGIYSPVDIPDNNLFFTGEYHTKYTEYIK